MLDARVELIEFREVVQALVSKVGNEFIQSSFEIDDIEQIAVFVERLCLQANFQPVVVIVGLIFIPPIPADEEMFGDKVACDC